MKGKNILIVLSVVLIVVVILTITLIYILEKNNPAETGGRISPVGDYKLKPPLSFEVSENVTLTGNTTTGRVTNILLTLRLKDNVIERKWSEEKKTYYVTRESEPFNVNNIQFFLRTGESNIYYPVDNSMITWVRSDEAVPDDVLEKNETVLINLLFPEGYQIDSNQSIDFDMVRLGYDYHIEIHCRAPSVIEPTMNLSLNGFGPYDAPTANTKIKQGYIAERGTPV